MNILFIVLFNLLSASSFGQDEYLARSWPNGNAMVVYTLEEETSDIIKEQVFYESGSLDYEGHYQDGVEHGYWCYYWPNGTLKSKEFYQYGLEEGTMFDYDQSGSKAVKYVYSKGVLIEKVNL
ncbi:MAG: toxin-antitoxin system YwqK family antitoxin [Flavobacteriales bacterium]